MARKFTNENQYPLWLYHTLTTNNYTKGTKPSDISVTRLIDSPQINALRFKHADALVEDVDGHAVGDRAGLSEGEDLDEIGR